MNEISDIGVEGICEGLEACQSLLNLDISLKNNDVRTSGAERLAACLEKLTELQTLNINLGGYSQCQNKLREAGTK